MSGSLIPPVLFFFLKIEQASSDFMAAATICSDLESPKILPVTAFTFLPAICHEVMEPDAMILASLLLSFK